MKKKEAIEARDFTEEVCYGRDEWRLGVGKW
jgi:hypothetical protein